MSCDGHAEHDYEVRDECMWCTHPRSEHDEDGHWADNREDAKAGES